MVKKLIMIGFFVLMVAMGVPQSRQAMADAVTPIKDNIGARLVPRRLDAMANQLDVRLSRAEGLPDRFDGWLRRDFSASEFDPWDNYYYLVPGRRDYTVGSMGPDGVQGTEDDITLTRPMPRNR